MVFKRKKNSTTMFVAESIEKKVLKVHKRQGFIDFVQIHKQTNRHVSKNKLKKIT
jgi:ribosomal protein S8